MTQKDQTKLINAGYTLIRRINQPSPKIKFKDASHREWATLIKFDTKKWRDVEMDNLLLNEKTIED